VKSHNRQGVVLIIVVVVLSLMGMAMALLTRQTAQLAAATRRMQQDAELTNAYLSACAYIQASHQSLLRPDAPLTQTLPMEGITAKPATASIEIVPSGSPDRTILLTIQIQKTPKPLQKEWTFRLVQTGPATASGR
jgi:hypothetical protein